jgi:hypothetical protein
VATDPPGDGASDVPDPTERGDGERPASRPIGRSVVIGVAVGAAAAAVVAAVVFALVAIPLYTLARADPHGLDRPFIRSGFFRVALPAGVLAGVACGVLVGIWYGRGGRLPVHRSFE